MILEIGLTIKDSYDCSDVGAMDYAPMHVINSPPQDASARKVSTTDELHHSLLDRQSDDDETMVTKENGQAHIIGVLPHHEDTEDSDMDHKSDHVITDSVKSANGVETKIKLNFSVDRLLGMDCGDSRGVRNQRIVISTNNNNSSSGSGPSNHAQYECCKYLNNGNQGHLESYHLQKQHQISSHRNQHDRGILLPPSMDIKAVVRPTPIRALGNGPDEVLSYSSMASSILKFHQHQQQQHHHHHHHHQQPPAASIAALSSLMAPFNGLKSLQINQQHFRQQANIQSAAKSLDIPPTTPVTQASIGNGSVSTSASTTSSAAIANSGKRKRSWSRAVFSNLQRKGLEIQFQQQKYITKPDRRKLAARLNLTDAQVKVWFQNRRMKWRHTRENLKSGQEKPVSSQSASSAGSNTNATDGVDRRSTEKKCYTSSSESDDDEIDVVE